MLILTRRSNERLFIGDDVAVVVLGIESNRVKLGIEAPNDVTILREEIVSDEKLELIDRKINSKNVSNELQAKTGT
ncbi:UNVERIFIED_CONTAM: hypothetical protein GTU68_003234 [Idotea baltica]|nr:hypothetical protein [Idotea baltica]